MSVEIKVPALGESVSEATIAKWYKKPGDAVRVDELLLELETEKVTLEVNATAEGILESIDADEDTTLSKLHLPAVNYCQFGVFLLAQHRLRNKPCLHPSLPHSIGRDCSSHQ